MNADRMRTGPDYITARRLQDVGTRRVLPVCAAGLVVWFVCIARDEPSSADRFLWWLGGVLGSFLLTAVVDAVGNCVARRRFLTFDRTDLDSVSWPEVRAMAGLMWRRNGGSLAPVDYELAARFWLARTVLWLPYDDQPRDLDQTAAWWGGTR